MDDGNSSHGQNAELDGIFEFNHSMYLGQQHNSSNGFFDGYMTDVFIVDGAALRAEDFGYFKRGEGSQNIGNQIRTSNMSNGTWYPLPPRTIIQNIKDKGGFGAQGGYYPLNFGNAPGLDFHTSEPDTILKINSHEPQPKGGLRNNNEFVNHKILDLVGDFLLSGFRVLGKISCYQGGHELTNSFLRKLMKSESAFIQIELETITFSENRSPIHLVKTAVNA